LNPLAKNFVPNLETVDKKLYPVIANEVKQCRNYLKTNEIATSSRQSVTPRNDGKWQIECKVFVGHGPSSSRTS